MSTKRKYGEMRLGVIPTETNRTDSDHVRPALYD